MYKKLTEREAQMKKTNHPRYQMARRYSDTDALVLETMNARHEGDVRQLVGRVLLHAGKQDNVIAYYVSSGVPPFAVPAT